MAKHAIAGTLFVPNFILLGEAGYFDAVSSTKPLLHLWSLGIEEQFYLIWPIALLLLRNRRQGQGIFILITTVISFGFWIVVNASDPTIAFYLPITRLWELSLGGALAYYGDSRVSKAGINLDNKQPSTRLKKLFEMPTLIGISLLVISFIQLSRATTFYPYLLLLPIFGTVLIISSDAGTAINKYVLSNKPMVWFGLISYPLYLVHWPLYSFTFILEDGVPSKSVRIISIAASILIAWMIFFWIERFVRYGRQRSKRYFTFFLPFLLCLICVFGVWIHVSDGAPHRFSQKNELHHILKNPEPRVSGFNCDDFINNFSEFASDSNCLLNKKQMPKLLFIGDSHMRMYRSSIFDAFSDIPLMLIMRPTCLPFVYSKPSKVTQDCMRKIDLLNNYLAENNSVDTVLITGFWAYLMAGDFVQADTDVRVPDSLTDEAVEDFLSKAREFMLATMRGNKRVILIQDIPHLDFPIMSCIKVRPVQLTSRATRVDCTVKQSDFYEYIQPYDSVIKQLLDEHPSMEYYDPRPLFCDGTNCIAMRSGFPLYRNGDHLNFLGAKMVIDDLILKFPDLIK